MIIRKLRPAEVDAAIRLSEFAFQYELSEEERRERKADMKPFETWVAEEGGELLSKVTILPLHIFFYGKSVPASGVSGVATWPEQRRKGIVSKLLLHSLEEEYQKGRLFSLLYPFSVPFYRNYGYELFTDAERLTLERHQLPKAEPHTGTCRSIEPDPSITGPVYRDYAARFQGMLDRDREWWMKSVHRRKKGRTIVYERQGVPFGYLLYSIKEREMNVHEIVWLDDDARRGLFTFIHNHDSMVDKVKINTSAHTGFNRLLPDPKVKRTIHSYFMARIVHVENMLNQLPLRLELNEAVVLHLQDPLLKENEGTYIVSRDPSEEPRVRFFPAEGESETIARQLPKNGIHLDIKALSSIVMGDTSPLLLWKEGLITGDEESIQKLDKALPAAVPFLYDFF
ncbi:GNAT family N-acetyltransferase [Alkalicoccus urumqiensis]|uniref:N-acetyltransferase domain-containing protein n=1 Tax=Alkalicoccus urumqiensis TaxID=1548213 RepID=A0A2P6MGK2_ALKUR|nr:GNAT family N-acetyltransferase [Alkalicoccus urumqiensis]PRO65418.1 hypothetical protein C6I21_09670 [Alkalicoccus urumqiensis]